MPGRSANPNVAPAGGTFLSRKLTQLITQPVSPGRLHSGVLVKVPPTSLPCGTNVLKPGRMASFMRAATAGLVSISRAISICSIRLPWLWPTSTKGRPLFFVAR